jgi:hypothetical protein
VHQVETLHRDFFGAQQRDRAGVVDNDIDAAECCSTLLHGCCNRVVFTNVADDWQSLAACCLDLLGRRVNRSGQLWMRLVSLRRDDDIGAVCGRSLRNRKPDAATAARNEECLPLQ